MNTNAVNQAAESSNVSAYQETKKKNKVNGKTIGSPELSEKAQKYYEQLKKKYSNMDFILVSMDQKEQAEANAAQYASPNKTVVLIDEEKIERMAEDEEYRKKYEGILSGAASQINQMKTQLGSSQNVKAFGIRINDGGTASFFAVVDKSMEAQKKRIEEKAEKKAAEKKKAAKEQAEEAREERLEKKQTEKEEKSDRTEGDLVTVTASSVEELLKKVNDVLFAGMSDQVMTEDEKNVGQHIDFSV